MDKNKLPYVSPEVEIVGIIPESSVLADSGSGTLKQPDLVDPWF